ncbi:MAG: hypothetical protein H0V66_06070 [Bdellovibrionales bacterium]|nr:hypothetical protein [Bdellovibrionales bacterium]
MDIHCDNCGYEGPGYVDKYNYGFFLISTFALIFSLIFLRRPVFMSGSRSGFTGIYVLVAAYLGYFFRPQKYHCPKCRGKWGTPLSFHKLLNP